MKNKILCPHCKNEISKETIREIYLANASNGGNTTLKRFGKKHFSILGKKSAAKRKLSTDKQIVKK